MTNLSIDNSSDGTRKFLNQLADPSFLEGIRIDSLRWWALDAFGGYGTLYEANLLKGPRCIYLRLQDTCGLDSREAILDWLDHKIGGHRLSCSTLLVPLMCDSHREIKTRAKNLLHKYNPSSISEKVFLKETRKEMLRLIAEDRKALNDV